MLLEEPRILIAARGAALGMRREARSQSVNIPRTSIPCWLKRLFGGDPRGGGAFGGSSPCTPGAPCAMRHELRVAACIRR